MFLSLKMLPTYAPTEISNGNQPDGGSVYPHAISDGSKSALSQSLGVLRQLTEKTNTRADGQEPKKRGPKPDSKPALTRRQELNRQAQRSHRERKELYIKGLELEVNALKENVVNVSRNEESIREENERLKQLLTAHGICWRDGNGVLDDFHFTHMNTHIPIANGGPESTGVYASNGSISGTYTSESLCYSPLSNGGSSLNQSPNSPHQFPGGTNILGLRRGNMNFGGNRQSLDAQQQPLFGALQVQEGGDYNAVEFMSRLERPYLEHLQPIVNHAALSSGEPCGRARLMATCPPSAPPDPSVPWSTVSSLTDRDIPKIEANEDDHLKHHKHHSHQNHKNHPNPNDDKNDQNDNDNDDNDNDKATDIEMKPSTHPQFTGQDDQLNLAGNPIQQKTWDIKYCGDLASLMNLSESLNLGGSDEIIPVQPPGSMVRHPRVQATEVGVENLGGLGAVGGEG